MSRPALKLVKERAARRPLFIGAILERFSQSLNDRGRRLHRSYASLEAARSAAVKWLAVEGRVKDVIQIYHQETGLVLGTVRMTAVGRLVVSWEA